VVVLQEVLLASGVLLLLLWVILLWVVLAEVEMVDIAFDLVMVPDLVAVQMVPHCILLGDGIPP
jgi:hypothetical protein